MHERMGKLCCYSVVWVGSSDEFTLRMCSRICGVLQILAQNIGVATRTALLFDTELLPMLSVELNTYHPPPWVQLGGHAS